MAKQPAGKPKTTRAVKTADPAAKRPAARKKATTEAAPPAQPQPADGLARRDDPTKFVLYNLQGEARAYYLAEPHELTPPAEPVGAKSVAHTILVIDRSGSMYAAIAGPQGHAPQAPHARRVPPTSTCSSRCISYSGSGDLTVHFQRAPIAEIMARDSTQTRTKSARSAPPG